MLGLNKDNIWKEMDLGAHMNKYCIHKHLHYLLP